MIIFHFPSPAPSSIFQTPRFHPPLKMNGIEELSIARKNRCTITLVCAFFNIFFPSPAPSPDIPDNFFPLVFYSTFQTHLPTESIDARFFFPGWDKFSDLDVLNMFSARFKHVCFISLFVANQCNITNIKSKMNSFFSVLRSKGLAKF